MKNNYLKYLLSLLLFGANGIVASQIHLDSCQIVLLRTMLGSALLVALFFGGKGKLTFYKRKKDAAFLSLSGIAMGTSWMLLYEAYARIGVSVASLLYYCGPVIVMVLSPVLFREKLTFSKIAGFLVVLCGIFLVNGSGEEASRDAVGIACGLLSALSYAAMVIFNKKTRISGMENAMEQMLVGFVTVAVDENDTITAMTENTAAREAWLAGREEEEPKISPAETALELLADHEYRLCLLELGAAE